MVDISNACINIKMQTHFAHMSLETLRVLCSMVCCRYMSIVMFHFLLCVVVVVLFWLKGCCLLLSIRKEQTK